MSEEMKTNQVEETTTDVVEKQTQEQPEQDIDKQIQSAKSKAKGDILKELGISSVKEFKENYTKKESTMEERLQTLEKQNAEYQKQLSTEKQNSLMVKYNIPEDSREDVSILVNAKNPENMEETIKQYSEKWFSGNSQVNIGGEKQKQTQTKKLSNIF